MDKLIQAQLDRTKILLQALEIAKSCENPLAEQLIRDIRRHVNKSRTFLNQSQAIVKRKKEICEGMHKMANRFDILAETIESINGDVFQNQSFNTSTPSKAENQRTRSERSHDGLDVSPCPAAWATGTLETPAPPSGTNRNGIRGQASSSEVQIPHVRLLHPHEMLAVPTYMRGRVTCENVNSFINTLNSVLKQKYSIVNLKRKDVKRKDLGSYCEWKSQEPEFGMCGKAFFTSTDLLNLGNQKLDKTTDKIIQILRHCNRLRQTRINRNVVVYSVI